MDPQNDTLFQTASPLPESLNPQVLYSFKAPLRAYKKRGTQVLRFYIAVALLLSVIIYFLGDRVLIIPIWAVLFLFYVLTITPPPEVENKITKFGVETAGITLRWDLLSHFYFTKRFGFTILTLVTHPPYYMHAYIVVPTDEIKKHVMKILVEHVVYIEKPPLTITDKMINALSYLIPDDGEGGENIPAKLHVHSDHEPLQNVKDTLAAFFQKSKEPSQKPQASAPTQ